MHLSWCGFPLLQKLDFPLAFLDEVVVRVILVSVCLDTISVISVVLFTALESRLAELCTPICHVDFCCVGWLDPFIGTSAVAGSSLVGLDFRSELLIVWDAWAGGI